jgi:hypothetical protein
MCHLVYNIFACGFRVPGENGVLRRGMFLSPPRPFELPPYASAMADCFAKAESPPPHRVRHFSRETRNFFLLESNEGEESDRECCPSP